MPNTRNPLLIVGATLSAIAAALHIGCIYFGAPWYRFFGAGEEMARMAEAGLWYPTVITLAITGVLLLWSLYALSGAGVVRRLPFLRLALCLITGIYLLRGLAGVPLAFFPSLLGPFHDNSLSFVLWSSAICLSFGLVHLFGLRQRWAYL